MSRLRVLCLCVTLLALTVVAYLPIWDNDFINYDDPGYVIQNPHVARGITWPGFLWAWTVEVSPYRMPLTWWSFQLDAQCFATSTPEGETIVPAAAVHGQNLFWHALNVLLLFGFWRWVSGRCGPSFLVAALFAVHPMHVESVGWAAERKDVLSGFFGLLALWAYVHYVHKPSWLRYLAVAVAFLLSLLAKPMLLPLPLVLLMLDYWPLRRLHDPSAGESTANRMTWNRLILEKIPLFLLAAAMAVVTLQARESHGSIVSLSTVSLSARLANALSGYAWYLRSTFYPLGLAIFYPHRYDNWLLWPTVEGAVLLLGLTLLGWWQARRRPWLIVGWLWFFFTLLPVSGLAQGGRQAWADRFSYWPHIGLFVAVVWQAAELWERFRLPLLAARLASAVVLGWLTFLTYHQAVLWRNSGTLWSHAVAVTAENDIAHEYLSMYYRRQGQIAEADFHLNEAARIQRQRRLRSVHK